jgi:hypothetical protein|tara:strand:+ start:139 stop:447 length:309 start_codon:yes stop_codon:yes gene_type:complete
MENKFKDIGIAYFTNPALENEPFGKEVEGVMIGVAKQVPVRKIDTYKEVTIVEALKPENIPSLIFTNDQGTKTYLKIEGAQLSGITVAKVLQTIESISNQNG